MFKTYLAALIAAAFLLSVPALAQQAPTPQMQALIKAAQAEGEVDVILSGQVPTRLRPLMPGFEKKYGIKVNFQTGGGSKHAQRILAERKLGRRTVDVWLGGANTALTQLVPNNALQPIAPLLIDPDVTDLSKWYKGRHYYVDEFGKFIFAFGAQPIHVIAFNTKQVDFNSLKSYWDIFDPKWKGKIVTWNPGWQGSGATSVGMYLNPAIGEEWFKRLAKEMNVTIVRDARQGAEWIALGRFQIGLFGMSTQADALQEQGFPVQGYQPHQMKEGSMLTSSATNLMVLEGPPHPKAAQLFVNWLLTRETQQELIRIAQRADSMRVDVDNSVIRPQYRKENNVDYYIPFVDPRYQKDQDEILKRMREIFAEAGYK